jgi:LCP family protein required for cell wall assembly
MRRYAIFLWLLIASIVLAACSPSPTAPAPTRARTAVPTWTLPFALTAATASPAQVVGVVGPTATDTLAPSPSAPAEATSTPFPLVSDTPQPAAPSDTQPPSPTARPGIDPTLGASTPDPALTPDIPIPPPVDQLHLDQDIVNILLIGRDTDRTSTSYRTDVMIVASINKAANSVTLLTIPRDLFVYIPGWTMNRINTAAVHGDATGYPGGGVALLEQTILYNLGIPIHGWARIDFQGFKDAVDSVGGVDVPVTCTMQDWRLKDPSLDQQDPDNWQLFTVPAGVVHMDGDMALWYARSRERSSDYDRSRRQHQVLRAIFEKALSLNMLTKVPQLYAQESKIVDTDLGLGDLLQFVPMAANLQNARIKSRFIGRDQVTAWVTPGGADVLLPNRDAIAALTAEAFLPPASNVLERQAPAAEVWNGTANPDWATLAADDLDWDGITPVINPADNTNYAKTVIYDFTTSAKGSQIGELARLFHVKAENIIAAPDSRAQYPYRVILGQDFNSCVQTTGNVIVPTPTPGPDQPLQGDNIVHAAAVLTPPPKIDGDLSEWTFLPYPAAEPIEGQSNWDGPSDLAATWNTAWDAQNLYLAIDVNDSTFSQSARGTALDQGDSVEVWLDAQLAQDGGDHSLSADDFRLGISPGNLTSPVGGPEAYLWLPTALARSVPEAKIGAKLSGSGYTLEAAIPWSLFGVTPDAGQNYGLALALNDNDAPGSSGRQTRVTNRKGQKPEDPTTWGVLVLDNPP